MAEIQFRSKVDTHENEMEALEQAWVCGMEVVAAQMEIGMGRSSMDSKTSHAMRHHPTIRFEHF